MKLRLSNKINILLILAGCTTLSSFAQKQQFQYKTAVQKVDSSGFYSIELQPGLTGKCKTSLADIRLMNEEGKPVPYLLGNSLPVKAQISYSELPHILSAEPKDSLTSYIAQNKQGISIHQLWVKLRNTAVNRTVNVLGSDDLQHWFAIKENVALLKEASETVGTFEELLTLPASTYRYFKIEVNDKNRAQINIIQAGIYVNQSTSPQYVPVPPASLVSETRADTSFFTLSFKEPYRIDRLHLQVTGTKYYRRRLQVYELVGNKKEWLKDTLISSVGNGDVYISARAGKLLLVVLNQDNLDIPLKLTTPFRR